MGQDVFGKQLVEWDKYEVYYNVLMRLEDFQILKDDTTLLLLKTQFGMISDSTNSFSSLPLPLYQ
jgi:hypothetical protein